jgi:hypothetical protein
MIKEAAKPFIFEGGPRSNDLQVLRESFIDFFREVEIAGELDAEPSV